MNFKSHFDTNPAYPKWAKNFIKHLEQRKIEMNLVRLRCNQSNEFFKRLRLFQDLSHSKLFCNRDVFRSNAPLGQDDARIRANLPKLPNQRQAIELWHCNICDHKVEVSRVISELAERFH